MQCIYSGISTEPACFTQDEISLIYTCSQRGTQILTLDDTTLTEEDSQKFLTEVITNAYKYAKIWKQKNRYTGPIIFTINKTFGSNDAHTSLRLPEGEHKESLTRFLKSNGVNLSV